MIKVTVMYPNPPGARFGFGLHLKEFVADAPNCTDIAPVMQISEVVER